MNDTISVKPFIEGKLTESTSEQRFDVYNPTTGKKLLAIPSGTDTDVDNAVLSARSAFDDGRWANTPPSKKKATLYRFADLVEAEAANLDRLDAEEMGKPISIAFANAQAAAGLIRFYAEAVDKIKGEVYVSDSTSFVTQRRVPRGVVAAVAPWNFPTFNALLKSLPAIAAGNCVVLKPSEWSTRSAIHLARLAIEAGLPAGVFNVVPGVGAIVGRALGLHMNVDMLTFTGSTTIGKMMLQYAGQSNMKTIIAECGGKSPHIVFDDAVDLDGVADTIVQSILTNQGQVCIAGSRLLVQKNVEAALLDKLVSRFQNIVAGDPLDPQITYGPIATKPQYIKIMNYIAQAQQDGAALVTGGQRLLEETGGYFIEPTILSQVNPTAAIAQEEIFGPVLSVITFDDEADAIRIANSTVYGLVAYIWTTNITRGMRLAKSIRSSVAVNAVTPSGEGAGHALSAEPCGQSGIGTEGGLAGMETYLRRQIVGINHG